MAIRDPDGANNVDKLHEDNNEENDIIILNCLVLLRNFFVLNAIVLIVLRI